MGLTETVSALIEAGEIDLARERIQLEETLAEFDDPGLWVARCLGEFFWSKQREIARSVAQNRYTAVHSCHDSGKSYVASRIAAWWLSIHEPGDAFVVSTAPTFPQVRGILWREIGKAHRKGGLVGRVNQTEWLIGNELVGMGRKPDDYEPTAFQGIHARHVLVIIDEACGIPEALWDAADTLVTNEDSRILAIGNPDDPATHFETICRPASGWNVIHISAFDTPNLTGEWVPDEIKPLLISEVWIDEHKKRWGENSPLFQSKVLGVFPDSSEDGVVPLSWAKACREIEPNGEDVVHLGLDVAASVDGDETVIQERRGNHAGRRWVTQTNDAEQIVGLCVQAINETGATIVKVDAIGVGFGIVGWLRAEGDKGAHGAEIVPINVAERSREPERFKNLRSELWWMARELCENREWSLQGIDDETIAQLTAPKYRLDSSGHIVVEPKADTKARLGRSPDYADALLLAFFYEGPIFLGSI